MNPDVLRAMVAHCRRVFPQEGCGVLLSSPSGELRWVPMTNASPVPERRFLFSQPEFHGLLSALSASQEELWGVVHSHPTGPPQPSGQDINEHVIARVRMVIVVPGEPLQCADVSVWRFPFTEPEFIWQEPSVWEVINETEHRGSAGEESRSGADSAAGEAGGGTVLPGGSDATVPDHRALVGTDPHRTAEDRVGCPVSSAVVTGLANDEDHDGEG